MSPGEPHEADRKRGLPTASLLISLVAAAYVIGSCSTNPSFDGSAPAATEAVTVTSTAAPDAEVATPVQVPAPDAEAATAVQVPASDSVPPSAAVAAPAPQALPATEPPTVGAPIGVGDLGLGRPITELECRGQFLTIVGASVDPAQYPYVVSDLLSAYPESNYARTEYGCSSLLPRVPNGNAIYIVFYGPFDTVLQACAARASVPADAYVKALYNISPDDSRVDC